MSKPLVSDELWAVVAPLLPPEPPKPTRGRPRVPDRACLTGIVLVLKTGIQWGMPPQEMGIDSSDRLGRHRWVVEHTLSWLTDYRRLTVRYERRADIHHAFLTLGCTLICFKALP